MRLIQTIRLALKNIRNNKLRSTLTMIGIVIDISSVIVLVALGNGTSENITSQVQSLGTNLIVVSTMGNANKQVTLTTVDDISSLKGIAGIAPAISANATIKKDRYSDNANLTGTTSSFMDIRGIKLSGGRFLSDLDTELRQNVVVLGSNISQEIFGLSDPIDNDIQINGITYQVIGVLQAQGSSLGVNTDDSVIVPITKAQSIAGDINIGNMYVKAKSDDSVDEVVDEIDSYLTNFFKSDTKTHSIMSQKQLLDTMSSITGTLTMLLGGIATISLLVGGIGVMNVMLVSVSERTKEIGVRKALGGKRKDIMTQFLVEALVLSSIGGILGVLFGVALSAVLTQFGLPASYSAGIIALSFSFSLIVGIVFGIFPAFKASKLRPIDALRYE